MIDHGIDLHRAEDYQVHAVSVSRIFRPELANGNLNFPVVYEHTSPLSFRAR
jgi:hypothetical protein